MTCLSTALIALAFAVPVAAYAAAAPSSADPQVVIVERDPAIVHAKLIQAADRVCTEARRNDAFGDFGSQEECIENSLATMQRVTVYSRAGGLRADSTR